MTKLLKRLWSRLRKLNGKIKKRRAKGWKTPTLSRRRRKVRKKIHDAPKGAPRTGCGGAGYPHWSGSDSILEEEVEPVAARFGIPVTSSKRESTLGNPSSDHYVGNTTASARDLGTTNGRALAHAIATALGITNYSTGNYNHYYIRRCGKTFRVQILWAVQGHYDHVHVGVRLA